MSIEIARVWNSLRFINLGIPEGTSSDLFDNIGQQGAFFLQRNRVVNVLEADIFNITEPRVRNMASDKVNTYGVKCPKKTDMDESDPQT